MDREPQITLIIPTHNRHAYLSRILDYYSEYDLGKIYVADSSSEPYPGETAPHVSYFHFPGSAYPEKINSILEKVDTEYIVFCADDDFIISGAIKTCLDFLNANKDYSVALGDYLAFKNEKGQVSFRLMYPHVRDEDIASEDPSERLKELYSNYFQTFYSVHRADTIRDFFSIFGSVEMEARFVVHLYSIIAIIKGKHRILPILYSARESLPNSGSQQFVKLETLCRDEKYKNKYDSFLDICGGYLSRNSKKELKSARKDVYDAFEYYLQNIIEKEKARSGLKDEASHSPRGQIGKIVKSIPGLGTLARTIVQQRNEEVMERKIEKKKELYALYDIHYKGDELSFSDSNKQAELEKIKRFITKHSN